VNIAVGRGEIAKVETKQMTTEIIENTISNKFVFNNVVKI